MTEYASQKAGRVVQLPASAVPHDRHLLMGIFWLTSDEDLGVKLVAAAQLGSKAVIHILAAA